MDVSASGPAPSVTTPAQPANGETPAAAPVAESQPSSYSRENGGIAPAIAKLFGSASPPQPIRLDVSYRVLRDPDTIVTVFSNPQTGQEVAQFPPEILVGLAEFFDQQSGVTLDQEA